MTAPMDQRSRLPNGAGTTDGQEDSLVFKIATEPWEFDQIHRLNYRTFVDEIQQYQGSGNGLLVDKFHDKNAYFIALHEGRVVGMVSAHDHADDAALDRKSTRLNSSH